MTNDELIRSFNDLAYEIKLQIDKKRAEVQLASRDGYLGDLYRTDFTVTGRGAFPIDMLRYCNAWPKDESSAGQIERSHESDVEGSDPFTIQLTKYHRDSTPNLSEQRWESKFRWQVLPSATSTTRL